MNLYGATFFDKYTKLSKEQISEKIAGADIIHNRAISMDSDEPLKIVLDGGNTLIYKFSGDKLKFSENGSDEVLTYSRIKTLGSVSLLSHLVPGTLRQWHLVIDGKTRLVTAFETWFGGYDLSAREVWREYSQGYIDDGTSPPENRHTLTNRVENAGLHWLDDDGTETLVFTPSVIWSSYVELSHPRGGITKTAPSDFFRINDGMFIYSRVDCEFSGEFVLEVIDLFNVKHIGVKLGFCQKDNFFFKAYDGLGEVTGRAATLEPLTDYGTEIKLGSFGGAPGAPEPPRGTRPVYRPRLAHKDFSKEETAEIVRTNSHIFEGTSIMSAFNVMEPSEFMVGKKFALRYDGGDEFEYEVISGETLKWRVPGGTWSEERYQAFEPAPDIIFFSHLLTGSDPLRNLSPAVDFSTGLVSCIDAWLGCEIGAWQVAHKAQFGVLIEDGRTPPAVRRHGFTTDLVGKAFSWTYSDFMKSIHVYSSPESYSWTIMLDNGSGGFMWSSPCIYIKLRDDAYLMSWTEDDCNGNQGTIVFNPRIMHDAGFFFGIAGDANPPDLHLTTTGALARDLGTFDIKKFFGGQINID
ncbi:MAG: molybdenum cofactor biosynthesis F family protein [Oscillospiraceae bacterium]|jgi:hypothetical protein|nr:molybdenum cofactor biosynthesis F family protein [Oscillospiraceae bacterium]